MRQSKSASKPAASPSHYANRRRTVTNRPPEFHVMPQADLDLTPTPGQPHCAPPTLAALTGLVRGAGAGAVLHSDGRSGSYPGLPLDPLLATGSPAVSAARELLDDRGVHNSFLWPLGGRHAPRGHTRVTVLTATDDTPTYVAGYALTSPSGPHCRLTPRELEILGLLVEGYSNWEISRGLFLARRTVAAHIEHILGKVSASTRTSAAVRAVREGLYVPARASVRRAGWRQTRQIGNLTDSVARHA
jgi:DNA-binding CsgD family transcriptional regulator